MKTIKRIKWENLTTVAMIIFAIHRILTMISTTGVSQDSYIEVGFYALAVIGARHVIKDLRTNSINWLFDKKIS